LKRFRERIFHSPWRSCSFRFLVFFLSYILLSPGCFQGKQETSAEERLLDERISEYFSTWSSQDMQAYRGCFHPQACVHFIDSSGSSHYFNLDTFIHAQQKAHLLAPEPMFERLTQSSLTVRGCMAQAVVRWELQKGDAVTTGTDFFTFLKTDKGWKILSLVFEQDKK
jgi:hypothetical protein